MLRLAASETGAGLSESSQAQSDSALADTKILVAEDERTLAASEEKLAADLPPVLLVAALRASVSGQAADSPLLVRRHADSLAADVQIRVLLTLAGILAADIVLVRNLASVGSPAEAVKTHRLTSSAGGRAEKVLRLAASETGAGLSESSQAQSDSALADTKILVAEDERTLAASEEKLAADLPPVLLVAALRASVSGQAADSPLLVRRHADSLAADVQIRVLLTLAGILAADIVLVRILASVGSLAAEAGPDLAPGTLVDILAAAKVSVRKLPARHSTLALAAETARVRMLPLVARLATAPPPASAAAAADAAVVPAAPPKHQVFGAQNPSAKERACITQRQRQRSTGRPLALAKTDVPQTKPGPGAPDPLGRDPRQPATCRAPGDLGLLGPAASRRGHWSRLIRA